jgi:hypothetical protein
VFVSVFVCVCVCVCVFLCVYVCALGVWQLGYKGATFVLLPLPIRSLAAAGVRGKSAAAGRQHTLVLDDGGRVWAFGDNARGQLGLGPARREPAATPAHVDALPPVASVHAGGDGSAAVGVDGELRVWGRGEGGALGTGDEEDRWEPGRVPGLEGCTVQGLSVGSLHTLLLVRPPPSAADPTPAAGPPAGDPDTAGPSAQQ